MNSNPITQAAEAAAREIAAQHADKSEKTGNPRYDPALAAAIIARHFAPYAELVEDVSRVLQSEHPASGECPTCRERLRSALRKVRP